MKEINLATARQLINFAGKQGGNEQAWEDQLRGAVAIHNILIRKKFAYLADEVGMGKTYVALGAVALFRHFNPEWRVLYIAPRGNIQAKWYKELRNFTLNNWLVTDNRVRSFQGTPAYSIVSCESLLDLIHQASLNPKRDFLMRLTSFSLPLKGESGEWRKKFFELQEELPWLEKALFDARNKDIFKDHYAFALNSALPKFDLVIIDEGHNLKHGLQPGSAVRNRMLASVLGCTTDVSAQDFPHYGLRFDRVLLLSATPLESNYQELWNQLNIFGFGDRWKILKAGEEVQEEAKREAVGKFLIRRITSIKIGGKNYTKNMYRREWRHGGVVHHDDAMKVADEQERLVVALVQKKVAEVIGSERFNNHFQIGMLASFESFLETSKAKKATEEEEGIFDDAEQTDKPDEREGADTTSINDLAKSFNREFGKTLPHPKMDAVAETLKNTFTSGDKALVFVRRVRSVDELAEKLNRFYDKWLMEYIQSNLSPKIQEEFLTAYKDYEEKRRKEGLLHITSVSVANPEKEEDKGSYENFFSYFFRGDRGPQEYLTGSAFRKNRLMSSSSAYSTIFEDNYLWCLLGKPASVKACLSELIGIEGFDQEIRSLAYTISSKFKEAGRKVIFFAYQEAGLHLLAEYVKQESIRKQAEIILKERFDPKPLNVKAPSKRFPSPGEYLDISTFFTDLSQRPELQADIWPEEEKNDDFRAFFRRREQRREFLSTSASLGHPLIDLWLCSIQQLGSMIIGTRSKLEEQAADLSQRYLDRLAEQKLMDGHTTYQELQQMAQNFDLIMAVNFPSIGDIPLSRLSDRFADVFSRQTPVAGMAGGVNHTVVSQFRMPGYPMVLITTDVLQEGEDLHTFCRRVVHYGISWTPSAMEQRTGRIDRIHSLTQRRLENRSSISADEKLQVYYPHLRDTVEVLQIERVYERMNRFIRIMHRSLIDDQSKESTVDTLGDFIQRSRDIKPVDDIPLESLYPVKDEWIHERELAEPILPGEDASAVLIHFEQMQKYLEQSKYIDIHSREKWSLEGSAKIFSKTKCTDESDKQSISQQQPFILFLHTFTGNGKVLLRCTSPIDPIPQNDDESILALWNAHRKGGFGKLCAALDNKLLIYRLTVEADLLFHPQYTQPEEVMDLIQRIVNTSYGLRENPILPQEELENIYSEEEQRG
jgi:ERCC4-related helicase